MFNSPPGSFLGYLRRPAVSHGSKEHCTKGAFCATFCLRMWWERPPMGSSMGCEPGYNGICHQHSDISGPEKVGNTHKWQFE